MNEQDGTILSGTTAHESAWEESPPATARIATNSSWDTYDISEATHRGSPSKSRSKGDDESTDPNTLSAGNSLEKKESSSSDDTGDTRSSSSDSEEEEDDEDDEDDVGRNGSSTQSGSLESRPTAQAEADQLETIPYVREWRWIKCRGEDDDYPQDWWFASTAIPLIAAALGPLANVMSIAALVTAWRQYYDAEQDASIYIPDVPWCVGLNAASLACGFIGNAFLLLNFTRRVRYIIALPATIIFWYVATGFLAALTICVAVYVPPPAENGYYSQGYWYAVQAACVYGISNMLLMVNMLGYFLGHYPQHFELTEEQRNLILQTMIFFIWLAGGAGIFNACMPQWDYVTALYFADTTILTVGFGDFYPTNDVGRGMVFIFSIGGFIILGLMVSSIRRFAMELGHYKVVRHHVEHRRVLTNQRAVSNSFDAIQRSKDIEDQWAAQKKRLGRSSSALPAISVPFDLRPRSVAFDPDIEKAKPLQTPASAVSGATLRSPKSWVSTLSGRLEKRPSRRSRQPKILILREERDRFNAMREIQWSTRKFKRYFALAMSILAFLVLWMVGATFFWATERWNQEMSYFQALYMSYISLTTLGFGDYLPKSNPGRPFYVLWSLIAIPTMTILISDLSDTVVVAYKRGTFRVADWTLLPKKGLFHAFLGNHARLQKWMDNPLVGMDEKRRIKAGFKFGMCGDLEAPPPTLEELALDQQLDDHDLARRLAAAIRRCANHLKRGEHRHYTYEEWVEYMRLIRFSRYSPEEIEKLGVHDDEVGLIDWDWIGEDSPMMSESSEVEWLLDRLTESLDRYMRRQVPEHVKERRKSERVSRSGHNSRHHSMDVSGSRRGSGKPSRASSSARDPRLHPTFRSQKEEGGRCSSTYCHI